MELLIVVAIMAILVSIAVASYTTTQEQAQKNVCKANLRILDGAARTYYMNSSQDKWPDGLDDLVDKYVKSNPVCPTAANDPSPSIGTKDYIYDKNNHTFSCPGYDTGKAKYNGHTYP